jgi:hypothetical protein
MVEHYTKAARQKRLASAAITTLEATGTDPEHEYVNHLLDRKVTSSSILPRKRRKLGNQVDLLSVTPDS